MPGPSRLVLDAVATAMLGSSQIEASAPVGAGVAAPYLWVVRLVGNEKRLARLTLDGTMTDAFTIPASETPLGFDGDLRIARSLRDNSVCLATFAPAGVVLRRVSEDGLVELLASIAPASELIQTAATSDGAVPGPERELCWVAVLDGPQSYVSAWDAPSSPLREILSPFLAANFLAVSADQFWWSDQLNPASLQRVDWDGLAFVPTAIPVARGAVLGTYSGHP